MPNTVILDFDQSISAVSYTVVEADVPVSVLMMQIPSPAPDVHNAYALLNVFNGLLMDVPLLLSLPFAPLTKNHFPAIEGITPGSGIPKLVIPFGKFVYPMISHLSKGRERAGIHRHPPPS